ncbi:unnamed protein product, partial [Brenthis ino]
MLRQSRPRSRNPVRSRSRSHPRSRSRSNLRKRRTRRRTYTPSKSPTTSRDSIFNKTLNSILSRLNTLESKSTTTPHLNVSGNVSTSPVEVSNPDCNQNIVDVLSNIITPRNYYVSNFDPVLHDINAWFEEVDRARVINRWDDMECLCTSDDRDDRAMIRVAGFLKAVIQGVAIDVLIDSGALEVSLISSNVLKYLSCQPKPTHVAIKGISDREIIIKQYVTLNIEFRNITVEVDLLVIPSSYMTASIIIGTDVLNRDGIVFVRTKDQQYLTHSSTCSKICSVVKANTHTEFSTPLVGEKLEILKKVINEFSDHFISECGDDLDQEAGPSHAAKDAHEDGATSGRPC